MGTANNRNGKWWLAVVALCCLAPAAFANQSDSPRKPKRELVPEGGSAAVYLLSRPHMLRGHVSAVQDSQAHAIVNSDVTNRAYVATAKVGLGFLQFLLFSRFTPRKTIPPW